MLPWYYFRIVWCGILILGLFLSATWIFVLLLVNKYGINSGVTEWVFMAVALGLVNKLFLSKKNTIFNLFVYLLGVIHDSLLLVNCHSKPGE